MKRLWKNNLKLLRGETGISLIEVVAATALLGIIGIAFLTALMGISKNANLYEEHVMAEVAAQSQMELIRATDFNEEESDYSAVARPAGLPPGYDINISTVAANVTRHEITVTVSRNGRTLFSLEIIKTKW